MAKNKKIWAGSLIVLLVIGVIVGLSIWKGLAISETFAECLSRKGVKMYGSDGCENCIQQKQMFGQEFKSINYTNCDFNKDLCHSKGVTSYPVWFIGNQTLVGLQSLPKLAEASQCELKIENQ